MSFGKKAPKAKSAFGGVNGARFDSPFGKASSGKNKGQILTHVELDDRLQPSYDLAARGLRSNLDWLQRNPSDTVGWLRGGGDPYYNALQADSQRATDEAASQAALRAQGTGNTGSTAFGSALGTIGNEGIRRNNQNLLDALNFGFNNARQNVSTNQGVIDSLGNLLYPMAGLVNNNTIQALQAQDEMARFNAQLAAASSQGSGLAGVLGNIGGTLLGGLIPGGGGLIPRRQPSAGLAPSYPLLGAQVPGSNFGRYLGGLGYLNPPAGLRSI